MALLSFLLSERARLSRREEPFVAPFPHWSLLTMLIVTHFPHGGEEHTPQGCPSFLPL